MLFNLRAEMELKEKANREAIETRMRMAAMLQAEQARAEMLAHPIRGNDFGYQADVGSFGHNLGGPEQVVHMDEMVHGLVNTHREEEEPTEDFLNDENEPENGETMIQDVWQGAGHFDLNSSLGFSHAESLSMFKRQPCIFVLSKENMQSRVEFFTVNKILNCSVTSALTLNEEKFIEKYVTKYQVTVPEMVQIGLAAFERRRWVLQDVETWLHEKDTSTEDLLEKDARKEKRNFKRGMENVSSLDCDISVASSYWSSNGFLDSEGINSGESVSSEESYTSFSSVVHLKDPHPEIHLGVQKSPQKGKYSVIRWKNWDAKGGKSGSLFVKTLDDRFVIKQIQKKEYDSFVKFAHEYFKYTNQSLNSGS
ncbi:hypothetical protein IFM89_002684 [Coptis chinensis]|uniref:PIPK domain-containing protein n=1 Tax=Coptis chinensis TaxID=261450 RepID=A0A835IJA5_9MAGN|nr:hypothetical protein IFM89_002684 [Coptis chinensis]